MFKKIREKLLTINLKMLWLSFCQAQKVNHKDYIELLTSNKNLKAVDESIKLEEIVKMQIKNDFPSISDKSFELLVDATMHLIRKKQLQATEDICFK